MSNEDTLSKLREMKVGDMADLYEQQCLNTEYHSLSFEERF